jgi:spore coat protein CotH
MSKLACAFVFAPLAIVGLWLAAGHHPAAHAAQEKPAADVFGLTRIHDFHFTLSAAEWEKMQKITGGMPMFGKKPPEKPPEKDDLERHKSVGGFGFEFPWAKAELAEDGKTFKDIGIRYKGNGSYVMTGNQLRRNFKLEFDHYDDNGRYHSLKTVSLNAGAMDPGRAREALAYALFRAAGVPAPRTAFAQVSLSVPGKHDKEFVGLYTVVEQVDKTFLKSRFKTAKGLLMKPERMRGTDYLGENWDTYKNRYNPKHEATKAQAQRVIAFAKLVNLADEAAFNKEIGDYLDIDLFLRYMAVNTFVANMDSFFGLGHNYLLYLHPDTNKLIFIPWDLDLAFGGFPFMGTPDQQADLSVMHPHMGQLKLIDRLLAIPEVSAKYQKVVKELTATCLAKEGLLKDIDAVEKATKEILAREKKATEDRKENKPGFGFPGANPFAKPTDLRGFVDKRLISIDEQLAGKRKGFVPTMGFGPGPGGPGPGGPGGGFGPGNVLAKPLMQALDADKDGKLTQDELLAGIKQFFKETDKDKTGFLDGKQLAEGINKLLPPPPGFGPKGPDGKPPEGKQPPPGFGAGNFFAPAIMKRADAKDGKLTVDQALAAAKTLFAETDKEKKGSIDEKQLAAAINRVLVPQGPPAFNPGDPKKDSKGEKQP